MTVDAGLAPARSARDVRTGGRWSFAQHVKNALIVLAVRGALAVADRLPERALVAAARAAGVTVRWLVRSLGARAARAARAAIPEPDASRVAREAFGRAGENLALCLLLRRRGSRASRWVELPAGSRATLERALARRRGVVFVSAHLGPFELLPAAMTELGYPCTVVVRESYDPRLDAVVDAHRHLHGMEIIHRGRPGTAMRIVRALRDERLVGFLPDLGGRVPGVEARFIGRTRTFPVGPQRIASRTGAALLVGWLERRQCAGGRARFAVRIEEIETRAGTRASEELDREVLLTLERAIVPASGDAPRHPEDWLGWFGQESDGGASGTILQLREVP